MLLVLLLNLACATMRQAEPEVFFKSLLLATPLSTTATPIPCPCRYLGPAFHTESALTVLSYEFSRLEVLMQAEHALFTTGESSETHRTPSAWATVWTALPGISAAKALMMCRSLVILPPSRVTRLSTLLSPDVFCTMTPTVLLGCCAAIASNCG